MSNRNENGWKYFLAGIAVTVLALQGSRLIRLGADKLMNHTAPDSVLAQEKVEEIYDTIEDEYLFEREDADLAEGMYAGLVSGLGDQYSHYYTKEEFESINTTNEGHYQGIGVVMTQEKDTGTVSVGYCYEGGPAKKAGIRAGDVFYKVDGEKVAGKELSQISEAIKGNGKDTVLLTIYREDKKEYVDIEVEKGDVEIPSVEWEMKENKTGYLAIRQFTGVTAKQFRKAYQDLEEKGMERLIVDLRDNPGGYLSAVVDTLNSFMPEGLLVYIEDREGRREEYRSEGKTPIQIPLVVLVNENSASASEIFAGAVKDHKVGTLVGTTTYGKGLVQSTFPLSDGSVVKLTISSYYTPSGVNIHGTGIKPDVEVKQAEEEEEDIQLARAMETAASKD